MAENRHGREQIRQRTDTAENRHGIKKTRHTTDTTHNRHDTQQTRHTTVRSDQWKAYIGLNDIGVNHITVNHSKNFVDPKTWAHTQRIESLWNQCKLWKKSRYYRYREYIERYVKEWCYRYNQKRNFCMIWSSLFW